MWSGSNGIPPTTLGREPRFCCTIYSSTGSPRKSRPATSTTPLVRRTRYTMQATRQFPVSVHGTVLHLKKSRYSFLGAIPRVCRRRRGGSVPVHRRERGGEIEVARQAGR